ncbi:hypothetical protein L2E82_36768 [Cichorium intybus]|uniref:Uncharacterized protein n=1 Tax=Cichorium intybus TaxID=13427 RepID=A0ACB9AE24_CICIN|nr:hypothetical protein L2E82_36768 [Cichorium intybus]
MDKSKRVKPEQQSPFISPEMVAALQLIQLSGDADVDIHSHELNDSACDVLPTNRNRRKEVGDDGESEGSSTSDMTSAMRFVTPWFQDKTDDGVAGRRKKKKFRSVVEIYEISNY